MRNPVLDMRGKPCPIPVIETKKLLRAASAGDVVRVLVDNDAARQNLQKMAQGMGFEFAHTDESGNFLVNITVTDGNACQVQNGCVVAIGRGVMGGGDDTLGAMLMKSFIHSLTELDVPPKSVFLFNGGVHFAVQGSAVIEDLRALHDKGTMIQCCGACLDYYNMKDGLAVGEVTNMYAIASAMAAATNLINL